MNGYFPSQVRFGNGEGFSTEKPGFDLPGGGLSDWRQGAYISDNWKISPSFTLTAGVRWSVDTGRANQDLAAPLCSDVDPGLLSPCSGSAPLFDQFQPGLGKKVHQPYANFGPQLGFAFSPGDHKTVLRAAFGIFYESDVFNNTLNSRGPLLKKGLFNDPNHTICGGTNSLTLPDGTVVTSDGGVSIATLCTEPISQAGQHFLNLSNLFQKVTASVGPANNGQYVGNTLTASDIYGAPYRTPYSEQWNGGIQREIFKGGILSVDYVHNSTLKIVQEIDVNHVGAARNLNTAAAQTRHSSDHQRLWMRWWIHERGNHMRDCCWSSILDFAGNGLDSGRTFNNTNPASYNGLTPEQERRFRVPILCWERGYFCFPSGDLAMMRFRRSSVSRRSIPLLASCPPICRSPTLFPVSSRRQTPQSTTATQA